MTRVKRATFLLAAVALLAACSGDDDTTSSTTTAATTATVVPSTEAATPSTAPPPTTVPATTTAAPTTDSPVTLVTGPPRTSAAPADSTTVQPTVTSRSTSAPASAEDEVLALLNGNYEVWRECVQSIQTCDESRFQDYLADPQLAGVLENIAEWKASFYEVTDVDALTYEVLEVNLDFTIPYVLICERNGSALVERRPGEPERVVDGGYVEQIREVQLTQLAGEWRIEGFATRERVEDQAGALCS